MGQTKTAPRGKGGFHIDLGGSLGGLLGGLQDLLTKVGELAEKGKELKQVGEIDLSKLGIHGQKDLKGVFGFSVKVGGLGANEGFTIEPFGNISKDDDGETVVQDVYEPIVDVFEEADHVLVVAELPGVEEKNIHLELKGDILTIHAERGEKKFHKEILLPWQAAESKMTKSTRNGVLEIKIAK
ncbi:MAG: Hsp20/alpha crystallin family protein [Planctomycetes bacterium]|nr:Hsp20/alpha crystallin family protein [Planctomycetota bacterium]